MIGRVRERQELEAALEADEAQLIAVCGRRRIGKTYLVRESFKGKFFFEHAGVMRGTMAEQLAEFGAFEQVTKTRSAVHLTFITAASLLRNRHSGIVQSEVTLNDLFRA